jgi:hypothetical protein
LGQRGKRESSPYPATGSEEELGGCEGFFSINVVLVEGDLMGGFAQEHGTPGAPLLDRPKKDQLLPALFAGEDHLLLGGLLHEYTSWPLSGITFVTLGP